MNRVSPEADTSVLALDHSHPDGERRLRAWLGSDAVAILAEVPHHGRYLLVVSHDTHCQDPRYLHLLLWLPCVEAMGTEILRLLDYVEHSPGPPCSPVDFNFLLESSDRDSINATLDRRQEASLRRARPAGHA
jgi:hypothetical protein